jgi:hypothetical protein
MGGVEANPQWDESDVQILIGDAASDSSSYPTC